MTDKPEAWERIAPEWPPGSEYGGPFWVGSLVFDDPTEAWDGYTHITGETRRQYAERIAPELVRQAAERKYGDDLHRVNVSFGCGRVDVMVWRCTPGVHHSEWCTATETGPDTCTAALACIEALEAAP